MTKLAAVSTLFVSGAMLASASTVISVTGPNDGEAGIFPIQPVAISFVLPQPFNGVSIAADLVGSFSGSAFVTTQIGPGTTSAAEIAHTTFASAGTTTLFGNLALAAGTYYVVLATASPTPPQGITYSETPTIDAAPGVSNGTHYVAFGTDAYAPSSGFFPYNLGTFHYSVTTAAVPEPATSVLLAATVPALVLCARLRRSRLLAGD